MKRFTRWIEGVLGVNAPTPVGGLPRRRPLGFERCEPRMMLSTSAALEPQTPMEGQALEGGFVNFLSMQSNYSIVSGDGVAVLTAGLGLPQPFVWRNGGDFLTSSITRGMTTDDASLDNLFVDGTSESGFFEEKSSGIEIIPPPTPGAELAPWEGGAIAVNHFVNPDGLLPALGPDESGGSIAARALDEGSSRAGEGGVRTATPIEGLRSRAVLLQVAGAASANGAVGVTPEGESSLVASFNESLIAQVQASEWPGGSAGTGVGGSEVPAGTAAEAEVEHGASGDGHLITAVIDAMQKDYQATIDDSARYAADGRPVDAENAADLADLADPTTDDAADAVAARETIFAELGADAAALRKDATEPREHRAYVTAALAVVAGGTWIRRRRRNEAREARGEGA